MQYANKRTSGKNIPLELVKALNNLVSTQEYNWEEKTGNEEKSNMVGSRIVVGPFRDRPVIASFQVGLPKTQERVTLVCAPKPDTVKLDKEKKQLVARPENFVWGVLAKKGAKFEVIPMSPEDLERFWQCNATPAGTYSPTASYAGQPNLAVTSWMIGIWEGYEGFFNPHEIAKGYKQTPHTSWNFQNGIFFVPVTPNKLCVTNCS